jgi:hypothetical protein
MSILQATTARVMAKPHLAWSSNIYEKFKSYTLRLNTNEGMPVISDIPTQNLLGDSDMGINTYRFNAFVKGSMLLTSPSMPDSYRYRGDDTDPSRLSIKGSYVLVGAEDNSQFNCINYMGTDGKLHFSRNIPLAPGESTTIEKRTLDRNIFVVEGTVSLPGLTDYAVNTHLALSQHMEDYVFTNNTSENAFIVFVYQVTIAEVKAMYDAFSPGHADIIAAVPILVN